MEYSEEAKRIAGSLGTFIKQSEINLIASQAGAKYPQFAMAANILSESGIRDQHDKADIQADKS